MSSFPASPRILKGGLVLVDAQTGNVVRIIPLQYNPESLTRSLQVKGAGSDNGDHVEGLRLKGPPTETIKLEAEIDAADQLELADSGAVQSGLHAHLAALETILYPSSSQLTANNAEAGSGSLEIIPLQASLVLFVFGPKRIVPVRITDLSITEEAFDVQLNPIRAKLSLGMRVLSVDDLGFDGRGGGLFMAYLRAKEQMASQSRPGTLGMLGISGLP